VVFTGQLDGWELQAALRAGEEPGRWQLSAAARSPEGTGQVRVCEVQADALQPLRARRREDSEVFCFSLSPGEYELQVCPALGQPDEVLWRVSLTLDEDEE
jgi:hypothetical protein